MSTYTVCCSSFKMSKKTYIQERREYIIQHAYPYKRDVVGVLSLMQEHEILMAQKQISPLAENGATKNQNSKVPWIGKQGIRYSNGYIPHMCSTDNWCHTLDFNS